LIVTVVELIVTVVELIVTAVELIVTAVELIVTVVEAHPARRRRRAPHDAWRRRHVRMTKGGVGPAMSGELRRPSPEPSQYGFIPT
jgi:hypothetical protein